MPEDDVRSRLDAIERRLAELEGRPEPVDVSSDERFWALNALKRMYEEPGAVLFTGAVTIAGEERYEWQEGRPTGALLEQDWSEFAQGLAALAHPVRLALVQAVVSGTRTTGELAGDERFGTSGQLYHHLRQLVAAGWLKQTGRGHYAVPVERMLPLLVIVMGAWR